MKEHKIEIVVDEKGDIFAETKGMQGKICADELDKILKDIEGERTLENTGDYYKGGTTKQKVRVG